MFRLAPNYFSNGVNKCTFEMTNQKFLNELLQQTTRPQA